MNRLLIQLMGFAIVLILTIGSVENPYTTSYVEQLKSVSTTVSKQKDTLYQEIEEKAKEYYVEPQDAKIDKVWKAMPGLNGLKVDVEKSYEKMKTENKFTEKKLVYKQVTPDVTLEDLPPSPVYRGHPDKQMVSFLINVAWGNEYIPDMLKTLKKHGATATFFLEGRWVKKYPDMAKMIIEAGHEVGNHSYSHPDMKTLSSARIREELTKTNDMIKATTEKECVWFAPPSGSYRDEVVKIAAEMNMRTLMWSVDTIDWKKPEPTAMVQRVTEKLHAGAMILMHPTSSTAKGLDQLIKNIKQKEYEIGNVSTLLSEERE